MMCDCGFDSCLFCGPFKSSNKPQKYKKDCLDYFGVINYFDETYGKETAIKFSLYINEVCDTNCMAIYYATNLYNPTFHKYEAIVELFHKEFNIDGEIILVN